MQGLTFLEETFGNGRIDRKYQCPIVLLESRAKELLGVARRKSKRKRVPAACLTREGRRDNSRLVTPSRPEAMVIYT